MDREREPRSRVLAFFLSFIFMGAGHAYLGQTRRALGLLGVGFACAMVAGGLSALSGPAAIVGMLLGLLTLGLYRFVLAVDTIVIPEERIVYHSWGRILLYGIAVAIPGLALPLLTRAFVLEAFKIPASSMVPTLFTGDHFFVNKSSYRFHAPNRGELATFAFPENPKVDFVKADHWARRR